MNKPDERNEMKELSLEELDEVSGGGAFGNIPKVPTNPIDEELQEKV